MQKRPIGFSGPRDDHKTLGHAIFTRTHHRAFLRSTLSFRANFAKIRSRAPCHCMIGKQARHSLCLQEIVRSSANLSLQEVETLMRRLFARDGPGQPLRQGVAEALQLGHASSLEGNGSSRTKEIVLAINAFPSHDREQDTDHVRIRVRKSRDTSSA